MSAATPRIGSLCTGYGGLDMAVSNVLGASVAWHCQYDPDDRHQYAARILAHHWRHIPNHGDITTVDWAAVEPVDIATAGFPCQDVSLAGLGAGIAEGTRSGLWFHIARAISVLRPRLVVIENVRGLLSARATRGVGPDGTPLDEGERAGTLRALGAVLGDLAGIGFDAEWHVQRASDVGAPHQRERVFVVAWPAADADDERGQGARQTGRQPQRHAPREDRGTADTQSEGQQRNWVRGRPASSRAVAEDPNLATRRERRIAAPGQEEAGRPRTDARGRGRAPATDTAGHRRHEGRPEPTRFIGGSHPAQRGGTATADTDPSGRRRNGELPPGRHAVQQRVRADADGRDTHTADAVEWGPYAAAIGRWEHALGRPAPRPTDDRGRLSPAFVEWMQGLPTGHVTAVPGLPRTAQLKALGNGVVPQQAAAALRLLLARAHQDRAS